MPLDEELSARKYLDAVERAVVDSPGMVGGAAR